LIRAQRLPFAAPIAALICFSCSRPVGKGEFASWLGPDSVALGGIDLDQLREGPISKVIPQEWQVALAPFQQATRAWMSYDGKDFLVIARGHFPPVPPGAVLSGDGFALAGSPNAIKAAQDNRANGRNSASSLLEMAEPLRNEPIWAIVRGDAPLPLHGNGANLLRALQYTQYTTAAASFQTRSEPGLRLRLTGYCATAGKAQELEESLRAMVTLAQKAVRAADLKATLASVNISRDESKVLVSLTAGPAVLREMLR
jgi:hypothetical protein